MSFDIPNDRQRAFGHAINIPLHPIPVEVVQVSVIMFDTRKACLFIPADISDPVNNHPSLDMLYVILNEDIGYDQEKHQLKYDIRGTKVNITVPRHVSTAIKVQANLGISVGEWHAVSKENATDVDVTVTSCPSITSVTGIPRKGREVRRGGKEKMNSRRYKERGYKSSEEVTSSIQKGVRDDKLINDRTRIRHP